MRIAILSYPMLFQRQGGLQIQIKETMSALNQIGVKARLINPNEDQLADYDIVHVFSAINGNSRIIEAAKDQSKPIVISPLIRPDWTRFTGLRERFLDKLVGKLTNWHIKTTFQEIDYCLQASDAVIALGEIEKKSMIDAFFVAPEKISVIPNGIPHRFFEATSTLFEQKHNIGNDFVLCVAAINSHKNQLALAEALNSSGRKLVLIGSCLDSSKDYLAILLDYQNVIYLGSLEYNDPLLASAYAAAKVFCLPSLSEVMPLSVLEALATGTPVIMTKNHSMNINNMKNVIIEINPMLKNEIEMAVESVFKNKVSSLACKESVKNLKWLSVAEKIKDIYTKLL
jgi:glycosyltransferase involved in cell wall biosynthesis